ncbi:MAG TPA: hypothetical protein VK778_15305 [Solirubrobacteraceae bacterium]|nr:hypothetical protein [Solirubrobacteraceae bacterium]
MAYDPLFDSAWHKWAQAMRHSEALEAEIKTMRRDGRPQPGFASRAKYEAHRHGFGVYVERIAETPPRQLLLLGDAANNFRAALDHLAWAVVCRGHTPPDKLTKDEQRAVYFPIVGTTWRQFDGELPSKLPGVRRADVAKIRAHQPYKKGARARPRHYLTLMKEINDGDKHRTIQPIWVQPVKAWVEVTDQRDCVVPTRTNRLRPNPLKVGAEITFLHARKTGPNPEIDVEAGILAEPCVQRQVSVETWLSITKKSVAQLLMQFSEPPPEIND